MWWHPSNLLLPAVILLYCVVHHESILLMHLHVHAHCHYTGSLSVLAGLCTEKLSSCLVKYAVDCFVFAVARGSGQCDSTSEGTEMLLFLVPVLWGHAA